MGQGTLAWAAGRAIVNALLHGPGCGNWSAAQQRTLHYSMLPLELKLHTNIMASWLLESVTSDQHISISSVLLPEVMLMVFTHRTGPAQDACNCEDEVDCSRQNAAYQHVGFWACLTTNE